MRLLILLLILSALNSFAQRLEIDSLRHALSNHPQKDTIRFRLLITASDNLLDNPAESKVMLEEALELSTDLDFKKGIAEAYCSLTYYYYDRTDFANAVEMGLNALREYEKIADTHGLYESYNVLTGVYTGWGDFRKAQEYMDQMQALVKVNPELVDEAAFYFTMGFFTLKQDKLEEGAAWIARALPIYAGRGQRFDVSSCYFLMAKAKEGLGDWDASLDYFRRSVNEIKGSDHPNVLANVASSHQGIGSILLRNKRYQEAGLHLDTALQAATKINSMNMLLKIYADQALLQEALGNFDDALRYERLRMSLKDSVSNRDKTEALAEAEIKYEAEKREQTITLLNQEKSLQRQLTVFLSITFALLASAATVIILLQRSRARRSKALLSAQHALNSKLQEVDRVKSSFFANISHEFRTPLTLLIAPIEDKLRQPGVSPADNALWQMMLRNANRLLDLINQILELARLENGKLNLSARPGNLEQFMKVLASSFDSLAETQHIEFKKEFSFQKSELIFDQDKIEKIVTNLLSNAFKFTASGGKIILRAAGTQDNFTLEVHDNGCGIAPEDMKNIFSPFFQAGTTQAGTGLGLALVNELVKLHKGTIQVRSNVNQGTSFFINMSLPKEDVAPLNAETSRQMRKMDASPMSEPAVEALRESSVLVVDDNADIRQFIKDRLADKFDVLEAVDGEDGFRQAVHQIPDLVILDVMMPHRNGMELCRMLKSDQRTSHIPVIMLTARADQASRLEGLKTGADDYLVKPFDTAELLARVENMVNQRKVLIEKFKQSVVVQPHELAVTSMDERFLKKALAIVEEHMDDGSFGVETFSDEIALSRTQLHRKLKAITGLSAGEFIQDIRLRRAALLIRQKADSITQIAYQVGFNDQSYFSKCFRKKFQVSPSEYQDATVKAS
jgi:signal transduction histidine kinase/DNA-binding response OmpR family regulator